MADLSPAAVIAAINALPWTNQYQLLTGPQIQAILLDIVELYMTPPTGTPNPRFVSGQMAPFAASYAVGQIVAQSDISTNCSGVIVSGASVLAGTSGVISRVRQICSNSALYNKTIRVHIHEQAPVFSGGAGSNWADNISDSGWCGSFDVNMNKEFIASAVSSVKGIATPNEGDIINFQTVLPTNNLYLTFEARDTFTLVSGNTITTMLECY